MMSKQQSQPASTTIVLHWFRHGDLRLHDNPALVHSCKVAAEGGPNKQAYVIPFFAFDTKVFGNEAKSGFGGLKCGPRRAKFVLESIQDLQNGLRERGSDLLVSHGKEPQEFVAQLTRDIAAAMNSDKLQFTVVCQDEVLKEETDAVRDMKNALPSGGKVETPWGSTMYELDTLPFGENFVDMPDTFTPFRNKVEKKCEILPPLPIPSKELKALFPSTKNDGDDTLCKEIEKVLSQTSLPTLKDLGYTDHQVSEANSVDPRGVMEFCGGETAALARVKDYIWTQDLLRVYFDTRNGMLGANYSTKFSPWLAHGCVSPRFIAKECRRYEQERGIQNKSTYWVVFELLWRDYCKFFSLKHGNRIFYPSGILSERKQWKTFDKALEAWKEGRTGYPLVDANMRELKATGFMSNRGRQNVCSFLALDLQQDWRRGGDYFETHLLDYDVYSNWYNWCAGAGMTGGRLNRFNIVKQSKDYDQLGEYVRHWLPELKNVPNDFVHEPWKMTQFQQMEYGLRLGVDYPHRLQTTAPPEPRRETEGRNNHQKNGRGGMGNHNNKQRQNNQNSRHQKYDMKSLKEGQFNIKGY